MVHHCIELQWEKGSDRTYRQIGGPPPTVQETSSLYQRDSSVNKGAKTQGLKLMIVDRKGLCQEPMNMPTLRVQVDKMEPLLHDQHMILVHQDHAAESEGSQYKPLQ